MNTRMRVLLVALSTCLVALLLVGVLLGKGTAGDNAVYRHMSVYTEVLSRIKSDYVEEPDLKSVTLGALNGLLESVDPFASYLNADQYKEYLKKTGEGAQGNVGLALAKRYGYVSVVDAVPGSPAAAAGLTTGDILETIRGVATRDMPLAYAGLLLQGKPGTTIEISVLAMRHPESKKFTLTRAAIEYPKVTAKMLTGEIGYVQAEALVPGRVGEIAAALADLQKKDAKKLVLDLRHNSSGSPEEGIAAANLFLDKGLLTYIQGQKTPRKDFQADAAKAVCRLPLVVLTNRGTAGGAEVTAAALLDNKRAEVVGERTYGAAAVRRDIAMDDGGAIILAVAKYYSPAGKAIQDTGVTPSVPVGEYEPAAETEEDAPAPVEKPARGGEDQVLKKAIEVLTQGAAQAKRRMPESQPGHPDSLPLEKVPLQVAPSPAPPKK